MQVLMARHPEGIRSAILQSVNPLHETRHERDPEHSYRALQVMFGDCAADPDCAAAYPELEERFFSLVAEMNETPIDLEFENSEEGFPSTYEVKGYTLIDWMVGRAFYGPAIPPFTTAYWPLFIDHLSNGKTDVLEPWTKNEIKNDLFSPGFIAYGLYFAVNCQDDSDSVTLEDIEAQAAAYPEMDGYVRHFVEWEICQLWDLPSAPPLSDEPISSDIPTLVLSGRYDPITPPHWAKEVAENLENAYYVEFPSKGHNLDSGTACAEEIKSSFLNDPQREPDTACLADEPRPTFVLTNEIVPEEGFSTSLEDINFGVPEQGNLLYEALTGSSLVVFVLEVLAFIVLSFIVLFSRSGRKEKVRQLGYLSHAAAGAAATLSIATVILLSLINQSEIVTSKTLRMFGYYMATSLVNALGAVVIAQIICGAVLIVLIVRACVNKESTVFNRSALTLVALAVVIFWPFYFRWDLVNLLFFRLTS
jgi:pimeloyl-ACP methyl ester carboxylesterase